MEIVHVYTRKRRDFGRPCNFSTLEAEILKELDTSRTVVGDIQPEPARMNEYVVRNPVDYSAQCRPEMSEHSVNTVTIDLQPKSVHHVEGGWKSEVDASEPDSVMRHRRRIERAPEFVQHLSVLADEVEERIKENNAINIYEEYFEDNEEDTHIQPPNARTLSVFRDPINADRSATYVSWYPDAASKLAVAYSHQQFGGSVEGAALDSYIWDVENPTKPDLALSPSSPLCCLEYHPKDSHMLVGGSYNGIISFWDTRKGSLPLGCSSIERSHRDPVYNIKWIQSKSGNEFFTTSTDGSVFWWDTRKLAEPTDSMLVTAKGSDAILGGVVLDYEMTMPTKFMVGTEQGVVINCNRKAKNPEDRIVSSYTGHHGPIYALQRNPFFPKYFMTAGDWTVRIWMEDVRTAILTTRYHKSYLTDACWSPTRPGVLLTSKLDGSLDVWDFVHKQNEATLSVPVSDAAINTISIHSQGRLVAVGARDGSTTLLELVEGLCVASSDERRIVGDMFERETKREKMLENRAKQKVTQSAVNGIASRFEELEDASEDILREAEKEFYDIVRQNENDLEQRGLYDPSSEPANGAGVGRSPSGNDNTADY